MCCPIVLRHTCGEPAVPRTAGRHSAHFTALITGDIRAAIGGDATFSELPAQDGAVSRFRLLLGPLSAQGAVLFDWRSNSRPAPGIYPISGWDQPSEHIRGLVFLGPVERPIAELHAESGTLRIVAASDTRLVGRFTLAAVGRGSRPPLRISLSGPFTARVS
jgi:hypothetical protein